MEVVLSVLGWSVIALAITAGMILNLVGLFGNWVILAALGALWAVTGFEHFGLWGLFFMLGVAVLGEVLETAVAGYGARKFGGSPGAMVAAIVGAIGGAILGTPVLPIIGTLVGACVGAFAAAAFYDYVKHEKGVHASVRTGIGAAIGKVGGLFAKLICGFVILLIAYWTY